MEFQAESRKATDRLLQARGGGGLADGNGSGDRATGSNSGYLESVALDVGLRGREEFCEWLLGFWFE